MIKKILHSVVPGLLACLLATGVAYGWGGGSIIIDPDPIGGGDYDSGDEDSVVVAGVDVNPKTLNLSSNIKFVTIYLSLEESADVKNIVKETVKITEVAGDVVDPIYTVDRPWGYEDHTGDGEYELMVKVSADDILHVMEQSEELSLVVTGELENGEEFEGADAIRTIKNYSPASEKRKFNYKLKGNIPDNPHRADIKKAQVWMNYSSPDKSHRLKSKNPAGQSNHRFNSESGEYYYLPVEEGQGYEWDVTEDVKGVWEDGGDDFEIVVDYETSEVKGYPRLVVTYSDGTKEEITDADLLGPALVPASSKSDVKLHYSTEDAGKYGLSSLTIYGWNQFLNTWEQVSNSRINKENNSISTPDTSYTRYKIASVNKEDGTQQTGSGGTSLGQNYPNPFNPDTNIDYSIDEPAHVTLKVYNVRGQKVATLVNEHQEAGEYSEVFDGGEKLSRGVYQYQLKAGNTIQTKRMVVLH